MSKHINYDTSLKIGDLVFSRYHNGDYIYKIIEISKRYFTTDDLKYYKDINVGDGYNPIMTIQAIDNLSIKLNSDKKCKKITHQLDASYLIKVTPEHLQNYINKLYKLLQTL